jgi:hypothetical protein
MDCLRSFNFLVSGQSNFTGTDVKTWFVGAQEFWSYTRSSSVSTFEIQGFKNVNVYGVDVIGNVSTLPQAAAGGCIPSDWSISISLDGFVPLVGGQVVVAPNDYNMTLNQNNLKTFDLGRYKTNVNLASPIESVKTIRLTNLRANGSGGQTAGNLNLQYIFNVVVYFKYEGE